MAAKRSRVQLHLGEARPNKVLHDQPCAVARALRGLYSEEATTTKGADIDTADLVVIEAGGEDATRTPANVLATDTKVTVTIDDAGVLGLGLAHRLVQPHLLMRDPPKDAAADLVRAPLDVEGTAMLHPHPLATTIENGAGPTLLRAPLLHLPLVVMESGTNLITASTNTSVGAATVVSEGKRNGLRRKRRRYESDHDSLAMGSRFLQKGKGAVTSQWGQYGLISDAE